MHQPSRAVGMPISATKSAMNGHCKAPKNNSLSQRGLRTLSEQCHGEIRLDHSIVAG
jgi:hypothetical protein